MFSECNGPSFIFLMNDRFYDFFCNGCYFFAPVGAYGERVKKVTIRQLHKESMLWSYNTIDTRAVYRKWYLNQWLQE